MVRINVAATIAQANQLRERAKELQSMKRDIISYQNALNQHWEGKEMVHVNRALSNMITRCDKVTNEVNGICNDIETSANEIYREERLEEAKAALSVAEGEVGRAQQRFAEAERQYNTATCEEVRAQLRVKVDQARSGLNNAIAVRDNAAVEVRRWS